MTNPVERLFRCSVGLAEQWLPTRHHQPEPRKPKKKKEKKKKNSPLLLLPVFPLVVDHLPLVRGRPLCVLAIERKCEGEIERERETVWNVVGGGENM